MVRGAAEPRKGVAVRVVQYRQETRELFLFDESIRTDRGRSRIRAVKEAHGRRRGKGRRVGYYRCAVVVAVQE